MSFPGMPIALGDIQSSLGRTERSRETLSEVSRTLVQLYEGNQLPYLYGWLAKLIRDPGIRVRYTELAVFHNLIRLLVDRVSTVGQARVDWYNRTTGKPDEAAQGLWEEIDSDWMSTPWDGFVEYLLRRTELLKVQVAGVEWDPWNQKIALAAYGPHEVDTSCYEDEASGVENPNELEPDYYTFPCGDVWDFSSRAPGPSGRKIDEDGEVDALPVLDPRTGRSAVPFVRFASVEGPPDYWIWDGQDELRNMQEFCNRLYTRVSVLTEMGTNKIMVLSGGGWVDEEGQIAPIPIDITKAIKEPEDTFKDTGRPKLRWDGPNVVAEIDSALKTIGHWVEACAATFRIAARAVMSSNEPSSGYSLQIEFKSLLAKHDETRRRVRRRLERLSKLIRLYWDHYQPERAFSPDVYPVVVIPDYASGGITSDEIKSDISLVEAGLKRRLPVIYRYEPGIPASEANELAAMSAALTEPQTQPISPTASTATAPTAPEETP